MRGAANDRKIIRNLLISSVIFLAAFALALAPDVFDRPLTRFVNSAANRSWALDYFVASTSKYKTFTGVALMTMIWHCWFRTTSREDRVRILTGTIGAIVAGSISRFLQHALPTHARPYYDPALDFHRPLSLEPPSNTWDSFPSDHVAVFAGLAVVLYIARPKFVSYAIAWTVVVESFRTYMGAHYPTDLIAGASLGAFLVWSAQSPLALSMGEKLLSWETRSPALFYTIAFFLSYQIATLFSDFRNSLGPVRDQIFETVGTHFQQLYENVIFTLRRNHKKRKGCTPIGLD